MSFFLPDRPEDKKKNSKPVERNWLTGTPIEPRDNLDLSRRIPSRGKKGKQPPPPSMKETYENMRGIYQMGKGAYNALKGKDQFLSRPKNYDETIERAKKIKQMEKEAKQYHKAQEDIREWEERRREFKAQERPSRFRRLFHR